MYKESHMVTDTQTAVDTVHIAETVGRFSKVTGVDQDRALDTIVVDIKLFEKYILLFTDTRTLSRVAFNYITSL